MRASTDSLDRFIENENPYDEVPFEPLLSPQERQLKLNREVSNWISGVQGWRSDVVEGGAENFNRVL